MAKDLADRISEGAVAVLELVPGEPRFADLSRYVLRGGASRFSPVVLDDEPVRYVLPVGVPGKKLDFGTLLIQESRCALIWRTDVTRPYHAMITDLGPQTVVKQSPATVRGDVWGRFDLRHPGMANMTFLVPPVSSPALPRMLHHVLVEEPQAQLGKFETAPLPVEITDDRPPQPEPKPVPQPPAAPQPQPLPHPAPPAGAAAAAAVAGVGATAAGASAPQAPTPAALTPIAPADHAPTQVMPAITDEPAPKPAAQKAPQSRPMFEPAQAQQPPQSDEPTQVMPAATATWTPQSAPARTPQSAPEPTVRPEDAAWAPEKPAQQPPQPAAATWTREEPRKAPQPPAPRDQQPVGAQPQQFAQAASVPAVHEPAPTPVKSGKKQNPVVRFLVEYGPSFILAFGITLLVCLAVAKYLGWL